MSYTSYLEGAHWLYVLQFYENPGSSPPRQCRAFFQWADNVKWNFILGIHDWWSYLLLYEEEQLVYIHTTDKECYFIDGALLCVYARMVIYRKC